MQHSVSNQPGRDLGYFAEMRQAISQKLIYALAAVLLVGHIWSTAIWPERINWYSWGVTLAALSTAGMALLLLRTQFRIAQLVWLLGLLGILCSALYIFQAPALALFFIILAFLATLMLGGTTGILFGCAIAVLVWCGGVVYLPAYWSERLLLVLACIMAGTVGKVLSQVLFTTARWSMDSLEQARRNMESARTHRAQLMALYKNLDQAYYQLERTNAALVAAWKTIEEAERFKSEFVANVSHELRTPLNLIIGFSEMMMTAPESYGHVPLPGRYRSDLNTICRNAQHLLALVDDVLDLGRIEAGRIALVREEIALNALVDDVTAMFREYITAKGLALQIEIPRDLPHIWIDRLRIRQVLLNLVANAARHTEQGEITIHAFDTGDEIVVQVTDTGPGISAADSARIFEEFRTTEHPFSTWHSGTGLGLPISKKFVELHGGRMGVESSRGAGACFWFTLPTAAAPSQPQRSATPRRQPLVRLGESERIVIVIHDDPRVASLLKRHLEGYQVLHAESGKAGVRLAAEVRALALITTDGDVCPTPPDGVALVQCPLPSNRLAAVNIGAEDLLVKPIARPELLAAIDRLGHPIERALIVDDEPEVVRLFSKMLRGRIPPQHCLEAYNGAEALDVLSVEPVDLVILDLVMPEVDGRTVLAHMASDPKLATIPVILVSATGQSGDNLQLAGPIQITRPGRFELGELMHTLSAIFNALSPGWQHLAPSGPAPVTTPLGPPASSDNPTHPMPAPPPALSAPSR